MAVDAVLIEAPVAAAAPMSYWRTVAWRLARDRATLLAGGVLLLIVLSAVTAPWLAPYDPSADRSGCAWPRWARRRTCWGRTSRGGTC